MHVGVYVSDVARESGGAFTYLETILNGLLRIKSPRHRVTVFSYSDAAIRFKGKDVQFVQLSRQGRRIKWVEKIARSLGCQRNRSHQFRIGGPLHVASEEHHIDLMWFPTQTFEYVETPFLYTVWDLQHRLQPYFPEVSVTGTTFDQREDQFSFVCQRAAYVITSNPAAQGEVSLFYGVPRQRIMTIPQPTTDFALNMETSDADMSLVPDELFLFYPAQFWPHKNHVVILEALRLLKQQYNLRFKVVFTGADKGNKSYVRNYAERLQVSDQVDFHQFVSTGTIVALYQNAFALVFPTFFGPENMPPLEAFALGCPVVASNVSGSEHQLGDAALLFDPRSESELAAAILKLKNSHDLRKTLISRGQARAAEAAVDNYIDSIFNIVDEFSPIRRCWASVIRYVHT